MLGRLILLSLATVMLSPFAAAQEAPLNLQFLAEDLSQAEDITNRLKQRHASIAMNHPDDEEKSKLLTLLDEAIIQQEASRREIESELAHATLEWIQTSNSLKPTFPGETGRGNWYRSFKSKTTVFHSRVVRLPDQSTSGEIVRLLKWHIDACECLIKEIEEQATDSDDKDSSDQDD